MNKKFLFGMLAVAGMVLSTSCSNEEVEVIETGTDAQVSFNVGLQGGIGSRANISDGTGAKKLVCAVYDANGNILNQIKVNGTAVDTNGQYVDTSAFEQGLTDNVFVTLAKGQTYTVAFWAQNPDCDAYTTTDLKDVAVSYAGVNNDETRDAFFASETFTVTEDAEINVTLKRPFAQINVGVTAEDWEAAVASGVKILNSSVVIDNAATAMNVLTGTVSGTQVVTYELATIPAEMLAVDTNNDGVKEQFYWLSMSYILADDANTGYDKTTVNDMKFTFDPEDGNDIVFENGLENVPVQRNWRTNILGQILTGNMTFNITIDPRYVDDHNSNEIKVADAAGFIAAINDVEDGGVITLEENVNFTTENRTSSGNGWYEGIYYVGDKSFTIDMAGKTISNVDGAVNDYMMLFKNDGTTPNTITIQNGTIDAGTVAFSTVVTSPSSTSPITVNLINVELIGDKSNGAVVKARGGAVLNIKDGTTITGKDNYTCVEVVGRETVVNVYDGAEFYQNGTSSYLGSLIGASYGATVNVYGGYGVSKKSALFVYSTGGTINAMGGEWIGNADGTVPTPQGDNNLNVLVVQNNTYESGWVGASVMNVTGGTYKGGISATGYTSTSDAQMHITGGTFNTNPSVYVDEEHFALQNADGTYTVQGSVLEDGTVLKSVSPADVASFVPVSNSMYFLNGDFANANVSMVMPVGVENVVFDGSSASNINELIITQNGQLIDNTNHYTGDRSGKLTIKNFNVASQIDVFAAKTEVEIGHNTAEALSVYAGNCELYIHHNILDANFEQHPVYRDANNVWSYNNYGVQLQIFNYDLKFDYNTVTDAIGHVVAINGYQATFADAVNNNIESFIGNNITVNSTANTKRAAFKVWADGTYAPQDNQNSVNDAAQAFINGVLADDSKTFTVLDGYDHTIFCIYNVNTNK